MSVDARWRAFVYDPRLPEHARLRSSDADRDLVRALLREAYAEGRLTESDLESRSAELTPELTLGGLLELVSDLLPTGRPEPDPLAAGGMDPRVARAMAMAGFRGQLMKDLAVFLGPGAACVLVWWLDGRGLFWPVWILVYTGIPLLLTLVRARSRIAVRERELMAGSPPR